MSGHQWATVQERRASRWTHRPGIHEAHRPCKSSSSIHLGDKYERQNLRAFSQRLHSYLTKTKESFFSYLPAFSSSRCVHKGRCTVKWAPPLWASESDRCSDSDSRPIRPLARNRNDPRSAGSWRCCIGPCRPPGCQTSLLSHCLEVQKELEGVREELEKKVIRQVKKKENKAKQSHTIIHWCPIDAS